jgi:pilus assembly protein FimV
VDPIAEADVYMAYGRDTQAEEILKEALAKDNSRQPIRAKLLEIYAGRKDAKTFEAVAAELHAGTGGEGAIWEKAAALGLQLDPANPLYGGAAAAGEHAGGALDVTASVAVAAPDISIDAGEKQAEAPGLDFDLGMSEPAAPEAASGSAPEAAAAPAPEVTSDLGFDLDLGGGDAKPEAPSAAKEIGIADAGATLILGASAPAAVDSGSSIDFDFELPGASDAATAAPAPLDAPAADAAPAAESGGGIDFDFNLDLPAAPAEASETPAAALDLSAISLDLGEPGAVAAPTDAHWQEVATKLDLAKAYQEMGDKDGARELLNEVLKEGDAAQQQQAQTMLTALG